MKKSRLVYGANLVLAFLVFLFGALSAVACLDAYAFVPYILVWFRLQYLVVLVACALLLALLGNWAMLAVCLILAAPNVVAVAPYFLPRQRVQSASGLTLKICQINVNCGNRQHAKVIDYIRRCRPDVILIQELTPAWSEAINAALPEYTHETKVLRWDPFGMGIFSRLPLSGEAIRYFAGLDHPSLSASITWNDISVRIVHVHPVPVLTPALMNLQRRQMMDMANEVKSQQGPAIVAGDFNSTIWSAPMRRLLSEGRLRNSADGFGWQPTWPAELQQWGHPEVVITNPFLRVAIDHCLVGRGLSVKSFSVGDNVGSDHSPLCIELEMAKR